MDNRILVVDDEEYVRKAIERIFDDSGYELKFAEGGKKALALIDSFAPDLVLLDVMMPGMGGHEVCARLKANPKTAGIMVLFLSGKIEKNDRLSGYAVDADDYLTKPYEPEELKAKVKILLRLKKAQDDLLSTNRNLEKLVESKTRELVRKERQSLVGQMVQGIVHNIRSPLTAIGGMAKLASRKAAGVAREAGGQGDRRLVQFADNILEHLETINGAAQRIESIVNNLLAKSRCEAVLDKRGIDLNNLIRAEMDFLDADMTIKHAINKSFLLDPDLPEFYGSYSDFAQVFYNLVKNATDAMFHSPRKELTIATRHDGEHLFVDVSDTGSGIAAEDLRNIFVPFFSTKPAKGEEKEGEPTGTGMGLYACAELMKTYGATLQVTSELGVGTTFTLTIPLPINALPEQGEGAADK
ncbi:sensor histidine kinase [Thiovibrio sp. JS02]